jgi:ATP-dependent Clp endopeptidase proteolytic subunit ClpP
MTSIVTVPSLKDRLVMAEVGKLEAEALVVERALRSIEEEWWYSRQAGIFGGIGPATGASVFQTFNKWDWMESQLGITTPTPFHLTVNSPGGRYIDSFATYDVIDHFQRKGHQITVQNTGMMCTQSALLMQAATRRIMTPRSWIMLTEADGQIRGNTNSAKDAVRFLRLLEEHGWRLLTERTNGKLTVEDLKDKTYRGAMWWISAEEALALGLIDEISTEIQGQPGGDRYEDLRPSGEDTWEVRAQKAEARLFLLQTDLARLKFADGASAMEERGQVMLFDEVSAATCSQVQSAMNVHKRRGTKEVELLINSPGGDVASGSGLMDVLDVVKSGAELTTTIYGYAASMGGFISQMGTKRRMTRNSYFMIHQVSSIFGASTTQLEDQQESMERKQKRLFKDMSDRTGGKLSVEELTKNCNEHDWWLTPKQALEAGLVDEII